MNRSRKHVIERFWKYVNRNGSVPTHRPELGACWPWTGSTTEGYGRLGIGGAGAKMISAHRLSFKMAYGAFDERLCVLHKCDNRKCTNPEHLFIGTLGDNNRDTVAKGRHVVVQRKLTPTQVKEIKNLRASGLSVRKIASQFPTNSATVHRILCGKIYRNYR